MIISRAKLHFIEIRNTNENDAEKFLLGDVFHINSQNRQKCLRHHANTVPQSSEKEPVAPLFRNINVACIFYKSCYAFINDLYYVQN